MVVVMPSSTKTKMEDSKKESRRTSKPLMERRRRARINNSLSQLKAMLEDTIKSQSPGHSKIEKADLLELTVRKIQELQRQQKIVSIMNDPYERNKFKAGYEECAREIELHLSKVDTIKCEVKQQLKQHLTNRVDSIKEMDQHEELEKNRTTDGHRQGCCCKISPNNELRLVPLKMPNGDYALVLPQHITVKGAEVDELLSKEDVCLKDSTNKQLNRVEEVKHLEETVWRPW